MNERIERLINCNVGDKITNSQIFEVLAEELGLLAEHFSQAGAIQLESNALSTAESAYAKSIRYRNEAIEWVINHEERILNLVRQKQWGGYSGE